MDKSLKNIGAAYQEINEDVKPRRGWNHMKKIDELLAWMYTKNILTKGEKAKKDSIFRQYYRYYNDGDFPRALSAKGISKWNGKEVVERHLEMMLDDFIKPVLAKYLPSVDRTEFRLAKALEAVQMLKSACASNDAHGIVGYYAKKIKGDTDERETMLGLVDDLKAVLVQFEANAKAADATNSRYVISYARSKMQEAGTWTPALEDEFQQMVKIIKKIEIAVADIEAAIVKAQMANQ